jgi:hypothetical protein
MTDRDELEGARLDVLTENTAQTVHKHLLKLFLEESRFRSRWIWELLQNARDAAPNGGVRILLRRDSKSLVFSHDGLPFSHKSVAHLIYHGSTKRDPDGSDPIGQFGTGFLTTHLISKTVTVNGIVEDGRCFHFLLDRRGDSPEQLAQAMDASWKAFIKSLPKDHPGNSQADATTQYAYPIGEGIASVLDEGIRDLTENAPYLLAFNSRIRSVQVDLENDSVAIEKESNAALAGGATLFVIKERRAGGTCLTRHLAVLERQGTSVAVELSREGKWWRTIGPTDTPRLFVAFPLTATRDFCLPVVVNDERLSPREDRDTVFLKGNQEANPNLKLLEGACDLAARLAIIGAEEGWECAASIAKLGSLQKSELLDLNWLRSVLAERFIEPLRHSEIVRLASDSRCTPSASLIPVSSDPATCQELWDLVADQQDMSSRLPLRDDAPTWSENVTSWAGVLGKSTDDFDESLTLIKLCQEVSECGNLAELQSRLAESVDAVDWLNRLHALIGKEHRDELFTHLRLIPDQSGLLKKITELRREDKIDDDLKEIADSLNLKVRVGLVNKRISLHAIADLQPKTGEEVLSAALAALIAACDKGPLSDALKAVNVDFFCWLVAHNRIDKLNGFTAMTRATSDADGACLSLACDPTEIDKRPLAPIGCWPEPIRTAVDLFPKRHILSDAYRDALEDDAAWKEIELKGCVRLNPLYKTLRKARFIPDEPFPEASKDKELQHRTTEAVELSALAFFENDDTGLDGVRRSKSRACALLNFLANYVLETDPSALAMSEADCECGKKHRYYGSAWLVPMCDRKWVPLGDNKQSSATAESIAQLFDGRDEELRQLISGKGKLLCDALKIRLADLSLRAIAKDNDTQVALLESLNDIVHAAGNDASRVRLIADEIRESPELLDEITEHRERRERVRQNRSIGSQVEQLLMEAIRRWGFTVDPTGVGSDCEVYQDHIVDGSEVLFAVENGKRTFLIEIKATFGDAVRMTIAQARKAVDNKGRFALCVVQLDAEVTPNAVRDGCRFVTDIGDQIEPVLAEYASFQNAKTKARARVGAIELFMTDAEIRFVVRAEACQNGLSFDDAIAHVATVLAPGEVGQG